MSRLPNVIRLAGPERGLDGRSVLGKARAPLITDGRIGDFWVDTAGKKLYGPKTAAGWPDNGLIKGDKGWTAVTAIVSDGARRVERIVDWIGGEGAKPATGQYVGASGFVTDIADAVDKRGSVGPEFLIGDMDAGTDDLTYASLVPTAPPSGYNFKQPLTRIFSPSGKLDVPSVVAAEAITIPSRVKLVVVWPSTGSGTLPGVAYERRDVEPASANKFRSVDRFLSDGETDLANGGWWEKADPFASEVVARELASADAPMSALATGQAIGFNLGLTRSQVATRYIPVNAFFVTGETAQGDIGAGAMYVRGTSGGLRAIQDAAGTWWNLALSGIASVGWFGAKGDATIDDTAAFDAAGAALAASGGVLKVPGKTFKVSSLAPIPPNVVIEGEVRTKSIIQTNSATANVITLDGSRAGVANLTIKASVARTAGSFITATTNCSRIFIRGVDMVAPFVGITLPYPSIAIVAIIDVDIVDAVVTSGRSIDINGGFSVLIDHLVCRLSSYAGARPFAHVNVTHVEDLVITNSQLIGAGSDLNIAPASGKHANLVRTHNTQFDAATGPAIRIAPTTGGTVENVTIDAPWIFGTGQDVQITNAGGGTVQNVSILNSKLVGAGTGVEATGTPYISVRGCKIGGHAIGVSFVDVFGGDISHNLVQPHGAYGANTVGISISGTTSNTFVTHNICNANGTNISNTSSGGASNLVEKNI